MSFASGGHSTCRRKERSRLRDRPVFIAAASGGGFSGGRTRQPDFFTPYLTAILGMVGLHDLTFFSVQETASGPEAVDASRAKADRDLEDHFSVR